MCAFKSTFKSFLSQVIILSFFKILTETLTNKQWFFAIVLTDVFLLCYRDETSTYDHFLPGKRKTPISFSHFSYSYIQPKKKKIIWEKWMWWFLFSFLVFFSSGPLPPLRPCTKELGAFLQRWWAKNCGAKGKGWETIFQPFRVEGAMI